MLRRVMALLLPNQVNSNEGNLPPPPPKKSGTSFSVREKFVFFLISTIAVAIPVSVSVFATHFYIDRKLSHYSQKIESISYAVELIKNGQDGGPANELRRLESLLDEKINHLTREREAFRNNTVYVEINKKIEELDKQIKKCTVQKEKIITIKTNKTENLNEAIIELKKNL